MAQTAKKLRIIYIFERLNQGRLLKKKELAEKFGVSNKAIQRDINDLRSYLAEFHKFDPGIEIKYDRQKNAYVLQRDESSWLDKKEILAISKVLLESRAFMKNEIDQLLDKLITATAPQERDKIEAVIQNEQFHYNLINNKESLFDIIWDLSQAIRNKNFIEIAYKKEQCPNLTKRKLKPVGLIFSEFYFYLIAYISNRDYDFPTVYRLDRIKEYEINEQKPSFEIPYVDRFKEGEFRKRVQFMYTGELLTIKFKFWGQSLEAVLDRLPTAEVIAEEEDHYLIEAEVFGKGIKMWLLSQGAQLEVIEPLSLRQEMKATIAEMKDLY